MADRSRTLKLSILADVDKLNKSLKTGEQDVSSFTGKLQGFSDKITTAFKVATAAAVVFAGKLAIDSIKAASDLGETISKVGVLFGDSASEIEKFAEGAAQSLGQTKQQALDAAANFAIFGKSAGLTGTALTEFSTGFVSLAADLSSFNNVPQDVAINAIGSALRGEAEPLRQFGVLLDDATLKNAALELGLISTTKNALTPQQKVLAAQKVIYEQTTAAQGDFARTSDGLANQTKILSAELENTKLVIGEALLPIVLELATAFSENIIPLIKEFANGLTGKDGVNEGLTESELAARTWGERVKKVIEIAISLKDELIAVAAVLATVFVVSKIAAAVQGTIVLITSLIKAYNLLKASAIVAGVASAFALNPLLGVGAVALAAGVLAAANALAGQGDVSTTGLGGGATGFSGTMPNGQPFSTSGATGRAFTSAEEAAQFAREAEAAAKARAQINANVARTQAQAATTATLKAQTDAARAARAAAAALAAQTKLEQSMVPGAFDSVASGTTTLAGILNESTRAFPFGTSGANTNTLAGVLAASAAPTINITVNGAMDKEGTARTLVDTLNNSYYRGTGGAGNLVMP
jgi:hypothetical protein